MLWNLKNPFVNAPENPVDTAGQIDALNRVDLGFVVDTTGSMGPFVQTAKQHLLDTIATLRDRGNLDLQVGLVEYRDHPPQERSFVTRIHPLTSDGKAMQKVINGLRADGGGDYPEAVYDGVRDACDRLKWRPRSYRFALLVGDAPPHGCQSRNRRDSARTAEPSCTCGLTLREVTAAAERQRVVVNALCMQTDAITLAAFTAIAAATGGQCTVARKAGEVLAAMTAMLESEFSQLAFDRQVLARLQPLQANSLDAENLDAIGTALGQPRLQIAKAIARLGKRGFLTLPATT